ncbi:MAG TPA: NAD(P)H-hydrate dehydratase, partial [Flavitalea sp.]|nr:NAD(P)H-hydrate dehydratase [Flavitalea sp.]
NGQYTGEVHILDIGLSSEFEPTGDHYQFVDEALVRTLYKPRKAFAHKGNFGHALLCVGSYGKIGAGVLAAKSCLRSGVGLLSVHIPQCGYTVIQSAVPEAMAIADLNDHHLSTAPSLDKYQAIGIGPGIDTHENTAKILQTILPGTDAPVVLDADALNIISKEISLLKSVQGKSILTPHPREFERLFGESPDDFGRMELLKQKAVEHQAIILLKGRYSCVAGPDGKLYFNSSGNPGMATGGAGDVLTGMITAFVAQGYPLLDATLIGMYLHGTAGDIAANKYSQEAMIAGDIIESIPQAFRELFYADETLDAEFGNRQSF